FQGEVAGYGLERYATANVAVGVHVTADRFHGHVVRARAQANVSADGFQIDFGGGRFDLQVAADAVDLQHRTGHAAHLDVGRHAVDLEPHAGGHGDAQLAGSGAVAAPAEPAIAIGVLDLHLQARGIAADGQRGRALAALAGNPDLV